MSHISVTTQARPAPARQHADGGVEVAVNPIDLTQRERIALSLLDQHGALTARESAALLELTTVEMLQLWIKRRLHWELVQTAGRIQSTRYFID